MLFFPAWITDSLFGSFYVNKTLAGSRVIKQYQVAN